MVADYWLSLLGATGHLADARMHVERAVQLNPANVQAVDALRVVESALHTQTQKVAAAESQHRQRDLESTQRQQQLKQELR